MAQNIEYGLHSVKNFRLFNFATGAYQCKCCLCGKKFFGDKYAQWCLECAIKAAVENSNSQQQLKAEIAALADEVFQMSLLHPSEQKFSDIVDRMRQLSDV